MSPDLWHPIGSVVLPSVPTGEVLTVSDALTWPSAQIPAPGHSCFGGILDQSFRLMKDHFKSLTLGFVALYVPYAALTHYLGFGTGREAVPDFGKLIDLEMMLFPGGRERTETEFAALFKRAGFELTRIVPTQSPLSVVEAR